MCYLFGDYVLDTQRAELHHAGAPVRLRRKVFQVLAYLLAQRERVVPKQELLEQLWPDQFVGDEALKSCIKTLRQVLGERGRAARFVRTLHGQGYRFVGAVEAHVASPTDQGAVVPPEAESSPLSGPPRLPIQSVSTGERKLVTLLSCTLVPASGDTAPVDLEALHRQMRDLYACVQHEVHQYGGTMQSVTGDRLLVVFGVPLAQEDHAPRAVLAALGLQQRLTASPAAAMDAGPARLQACLRLHTATVLVGSLADAPDMAAVIIGDTSRVLDALQTQGAPGTVVCSAATAPWLTGLVRLQAVPAAPGPGTPTPPTAYTILGVRAQRRPGAWRARQGLRPFVGRTHELATLHTVLAQVEAGRGQMVGIVGAPGIGKSRLLLEFQHRLRGRQLTYLRGRCLSYGQATPYLPVLDGLRQAWGIVPAERAEGITAKVRRGLQEVGLAPDDAAALLLPLLGVEGDLAPLAALPPDVRKARTFATLVQLCLRGSQQRPLILEIEDLHWSDATSDAWLTALGACLGTTPILVLGTYRPGYRPPWLDRSYATQLALPPLSAPESQRLLQARLPAALESQPLLQTMLAKAAGNPFFLEELARTVREQGTPALPRGVPETVQGVLATRIDRLPAEAKRLLQVAAVCGTEVPSPLLQAVVAQPEEVVQHHLAALQTAELLVTRRLFPTPLYAFQHALTQDVVYQSLLARTRQQFHQQIAEVLAARFPDTVATEPERLAHHYTAAALHAHAVPYWQRAGAYANQRSAYREAVSHLTRGLEGLAQLPDTPERAEQELQLQLTLGPAWIALQGYWGPEVERTYARARVLSQQVGDSPQLFLVLRGLQWFYVTRPEYQTAYALGNQLLALAQRAHDPTLLLEAHVAMGNTLYGLGEFPRAHAHFTKTIALYDPTRHRTLAREFAVDHGGYGFAFAALTLWLLGSPDQALRHSHTALTLAEEAHHPLSLLHILTWSAILHLFRREGQTAQTRAEAAMTGLVEQEWLSFVFLQMSLRGGALVTQGHIAEGLKALSQGLAAWCASGSKGGQTYGLALLAEAHGAAGQHQEGLTVLAEAFTLVHTTGERLYEAELYRLKGELLYAHAVECAPEAEACFQQALVVARRQQAKSLELRAAMSLGRLWQAQDKRAVAYTVVAEVYSWFTEGFDTADLREAKALLDELA